MDSHTILSPPSNGVTIKPGSLKRRRYPHVSINNLSVTILIFGGSSSSPPSLLFARSNVSDDDVGASSFPFGACAYSTSPSFMKHIPTRRKHDVGTTAFTTQYSYPLRSSISNPSRNHKRKIITYSASLSSSELPSQNYSDDYNIEWDDNMASPAQSINDFRRRHGVLPNLRRDVIMTGNNNDGMFQSDDEWESYLNMDVAIDEIGDIINFNNGEGKINDRIPLQLVESKEDMLVEGGSKTNRSLSKASDARKSGASIPATEDEREAIHNMIDSKADDIQNKSNPDATPASQLQQKQQQKQTQSTPKSSQSSRQRITTDQINLIKSSVSLVDVIESYNLPHFTRSSSSNSYSPTTATAKACCPFHDDHNPSMSIDNSRGLYKCFVCDAGGDVFNFIREYDYLDKTKKGGGGQKKMGYMQAVEYVAREFGDADLVKDWNFGSGSRDGSTEGMSDAAKENIRQREWKKERSVPNWKFHDTTTALYSNGC